jgi:hypothetical protein
MSKVDIVNLCISNKHTREKHRTGFHLDRGKHVCILASLTIVNYKSLLSKIDTCDDSQTQGQEHCWIVLFYSNN